MIKPIDRTYARKLRSLRLQRDLQQKQVAELLGLKSQQEYSKLENGKKHFSDDIISVICRVFSIEPGLFKTGKVEPEVPVLEKETAGTHLKLIKALEDEIVSNKIIDLYKTKARLEHELKIINELIEEKLSKKYLFYDQEKGKVYMCTFQ